MNFDKALGIGCYLLGLAGSISVIDMDHSLLFKMSMIFLNSLTIFCAGLIFGSKK